MDEKIYTKNKPNPDGSKTRIWFEKSVRKQYEDLKKEGIVMQPFPEYVRAAYFDKIQVILATKGEKK